MSQTSYCRPAVVAPSQHPANLGAGGRLEQLRRQLRILQVERAAAYGLSAGRSH